MKHSRYTWAFAGAVLLLTVAALASFREISALSAGPQDAALPWISDTLSTATSPATAIAPPSYAAVAASDESWRQQNARQFSISELRVRGDGRRTARQTMQDRVFAFTRRGDRGSAIAELERWVDSRPRDSDALLWLARLLNESGRSKESIKRYRQALAIEAVR
jgi:Flp pilus assembly protein TadD